MDQDGAKSPTGQVEGPIHRLTTGSGNEVDPACSAAGIVAFTHLDVRHSIWSIPLEQNQAMPHGRLERIGDNPATQRNPSLSRNGRYLAFLSDRSGRGSVWLRELATGKELSVASSSFVHGFPVSNASGSRIGARTCRSVHA